MAHIVGIDLGTTNSVVSFVEGGKSEVIANSEGEKTTPSVVLYRGAGEVIVGVLAKRQQVQNPTTTIRSIKRLIGLRYEEIKGTLDHFAYTIVGDENDNPLVDLGWGKVRPEDVSAEILKKMKSTAEDFLHEEVYQAVITVPAYFNDSQRAQTKKAAELAGLEVMRIINEPTAAALAYGLHKNKEEHIAVFDFGGGTFDISILELDGDVFEVKSTNGDTQLGGDNIDLILYNYIKDGILADCGVSIESDLQAVQRVFETAEKVKCELSTLKSTVISLPFIGYSEQGAKHYHKEITREVFESLIQHLFEKLIMPCRIALEDAKLGVENIDSVILVGGSTRIPAVQRIVKEFFKKEPSKEINPDEAVSLGAAIQGSVLSGSLQEVLLLDISPLSLGIELAGGIFAPLIPRNSSIPTTATKKFTTVVDNQDTVFVHVLQGERKLASENRSLSHFRLKGIPKMPKEIPEVEVKFHIDANGILNVSARDCTSGLEKIIQVESYQNITVEEAKKIIDQAEDKAKEDLEKLGQLRIKNAAKDVIQGVLDFLEDNAESVSEIDMKSIKETAIKLELAIFQNRFNDIADLQVKLVDFADNYGDKYLPYKTGDKRKKSTELTTKKGFLQYNEDNIPEVLYKKEKGEASKTPDIIPQPLDALAAAVEAALPPPEIEPVKIVNPALEDSEDGIVDLNARLEKNPD